MLFYGVTTAFEFLALVVLRHAEPRTPRPFKVPLGPHALLLTCLPPLFLCVLLVCLASHASSMFFFATTAISTATYFVAHGFSCKAVSAIWQPQPAVSACLYGVTVPPVRLRQQPRAQGGGAQYLFRQTPSGIGYGKVRTAEEPAEGVELAHALEQGVAAATAGAVPAPGRGGGRGRGGQSRSNG